MRAVIVLWFATLNVPAGLQHGLLGPVTEVEDRQECLFYVGTYVNGRRLPLQGRGWGFESLRAYQSLSDRHSCLSQLALRTDRNVRPTFEISELDMTLRVVIEV